MDDNNGIPATNGFSNPEPNQPIEQIGQPAPQPTPQPTNFDNPVDQPVAAQPVSPQPIEQPFIGAPIASAEMSSDNSSSKKNLGLIIGCAVGAVAVIAVVAVVLINLMGHGKKVVACTADTTIMGIPVKSHINVNIEDGGISGGDITTTIDLKNMQDSYKNYEKNMVDNITENYKNQCKDHCTFDYSYSEGDNVKYTMQYDKDSVNQIVRSYGIEGLSAQEIADKVQETLESSDTTCTQH